MKRKIYIAAFILLGILLQFIVHAVIEFWYINMLLRDYGTYGFGLTWQAWFAVHHTLAILLFVLGALFGYRQGIYWWNYLYMQKKGRRWFRNLKTEF